MRTLDSTQTHLQDTVILLQEVGHNSKSLVNSLEELNSTVLWRPPPPSDFRCVHTLYGEYVNENCREHLKFVKLNTYMYSLFPIYVVSPTRRNINSEKSLEAEREYISSFLIQVALVAEYEFNHLP